ncbi:MAG: EAL domain-containing protein [Thermomicrobiales bacterium]
MVTSPIAAEEAVAYTLSRFAPPEADTIAFNAVIETLRLVCDVGSYASALVAVEAGDGLESLAAVSSSGAVAIPGIIPDTWLPLLATALPDPSDPSADVPPALLALPLEGGDGALIVTRVALDVTRECLLLVAKHEGAGPVAKPHEAHLRRMATIIATGVQGDRLHHRRHQSFQALLEHLRESITIIGPDGRLIYESPAARRMLGYDPGVLDAYDESQLVSMVHPDDWPIVTHISERLRADPDLPQRFEFRSQHADGTWRWLSAYATNLIADPAVGGMVFSTVDVTERKDYQTRLEYEATHDFLTGVANRSSLERSLNQRLAAGAPVSLLYVDLDGFHGINSAYGHACGDGVLKEISHRLDQQRRATEVVSRFGGDEFLIVIPATDTRIVRRRAQSFLACFHDPCRIGERLIPVRASIGISRAPRDGDDLPTLYRAADRALYRVKDGGAGQIAFFSQRLDGHRAVTDTLAREFLGAVASGALRLYFQPIRELATRTIVSYEGLIRWNHPLLGLLTPRDILPMVNEFGYGDLLAAFCIKAAIDGIRRLEVPVAINLSPNQLHHQDLVTDLAAAVQESGIDPSQLVIEVTEATAVVGQGDGMQALDAFHRLGLRIAIDDFGTGYSDLAALRTYPIDVLKIDRSFLTALDGKEADYALVSAILAVASALNLDVIAEGIETDHQFGAVAALGCRFGQGYLLGRPLPIEALTAGG